MNVFGKLFSRSKGKPGTTTSVAAATSTSPAAKTTLPALLREAETAYNTGEWQKACSAYRQVTELDPGNAQAHYMLGASTLQCGDASNCLLHIRRAITQKPDVAIYHYSLANILLSLDRAGEAVNSYLEAIRLDPETAEWRIDAAAAMVLTAQLDDAMATAFPAQPARDTATLYQLAVALYQHRALKPALVALRETVTQAPTFASGQLMLAACLRDLRLIVEAEIPAREATMLDPDKPDNWFMLGSIMARQAKHDEAAGYYRKAIALAPHYDAAWRSLLFSMNYATQWTPQEVYQAHITAAARFPATERPTIAPSHREPGHRLRLGYLSGDFRRHPVSWFIKPVLQHHDRQNFEIFCYSIGAEDDVTTTLRQCSEHWRQVNGCSDDELATQIRADDLDILVDLAGHSDGHRLAVMARRLAPVQVTYLGYPNTTGLKTIDFRFTDAVADPHGTTDDVHSEKLVRLPDTFLCYAPPYHGEPSPILPCLKNSYITFGSFNNFAKLSPFNIELWASVLKAIPDSHFFLKTRGLEDPGLQALARQRFEQAGIDAERLHIALPDVSHDDHMQNYANIDIALDSFPYNGTTTTMDALWMGIPVITLAGDRHVARVSASILTAAGLPELVANSTAEYVAIATQLATDRQRLQQLHSNMRQRLLSSPLLDGKTFTHNLEQAYHAMWQQALAGTLDTCQLQRTPETGQDPALR